MNPPQMPLCSLAMGQRATVIKITLCGSLCRRLTDLGLIEGTRIQPLMISPSGDPTAYLVRGTVIAIRRCDAKYILVTPCPKEETTRGKTATDRCAGRQSQCRKKHGI